MTPHEPRSRLTELASLALPIVLGNISHTVVSIVDTLMVGRLGEVPLAALGAASAVFLVLFLSFSAIAQGVQVLCARRLGQGRLKETGAVLQNGLLVGLMLGAVAAATGLTLPEYLMPLFTGDSGATSVISSAEQAVAWGGTSTDGIAADYLRWRWGSGMFLVILVFVFKGFYWGVGITRVDLAVSLVVNLLNILLNWLLIFGELGFPQMGAPGAGLASALANLAAVGIYVYLAARREFRSEYATFTAFKGSWALVGRIVRLSLPRAVQGLAFGASAVFFAIIGNAIGDEGLATSTVIWRFFGIMVLIGVGIGTAVSTLVARELGAGNPDAAEHYGWTAVRLGAGVILVLGSLCFLFARQVLGLFHLPDSAIESGLPVFRMMLALQVLDVTGIVLSKALVGAGQVLFVMFAEIFVSWGVCIPVCLLFLHLLRESNPLLGAWCGWAGYILAWTLIMVLRWRQGSWKRVTL